VTRARQKEGTEAMRLTERSMRRIADDLHAGDRSTSDGDHADGSIDHRRWIHERASGAARVERVQLPGGWLTRLWRLPSARGHA
jgi:hypothetical protein